MPPGPRRSLGRRYLADGAAAPSPGALRGRVTCARPSVQPSSPGGTESAHAEPPGRPRSGQACRNGLNPVISPETGCAGHPWIPLAALPSERPRRFFHVLGLPLATLPYFSSSSLGHLSPLPSPCRRPRYLEGGSAFPGEPEDYGVRCGPTWFPSTAPAADDAAQGSHSQPCQPALGPQQGACCSSGRECRPALLPGEVGAAGCSGAGPRGTRGEAALTPQPPARADFPGPAGHGGVPGLSVRGAPPWCPGAPHCFPPEVAEDVDDTKPAPSCVLSFCCSSGYDVGGRVVWRALSHRCFKFANGCKARGGCLLGFFRFLLVGLDSRACPPPPLAPKSCVWEWN